MRGKTFLISITLITILFISMIVYREYYKIDGVIIFEHKYEVNIIGGRFDARLNYLTNRGEDKDIYRIDFDNLETPLFGNSNVFIQYEEYLHKVIWLDSILDELDKDKLEQGHIELDYATISYTDGSTDRVNFGLIVLKKKEMSENTITSYLSSSSSGPDSVYTSKDVYLLEGDAIIEEIESFYLYDLLDEYDLNINNRHISNTGIHKSETKIRVNQEVSSPLTIMAKRNDVHPYVIQQYSLELNLVDGRHTHAYLSYQPNLTDKQLREYVKEKEFNNE
ncbi:hypothetical protein KHQ82_01790 [Mycoplasmatota bacterium]|nr:hypothetical protein KHQ82_01790 [Mycoplasmatota bacterium]